MAKNKNKNKKQNSEENKAAADYYHLNTEAVEKLVNAKDAPEVSDKEIRKYTSKGKFHIPTTVKIMFIKFWFSGAVCFFFIMGLSSLMGSFELLVATAIALGLVTDLLVNHILHSMEAEEREFDKWMMVTMRKHWSVFLNVLYSGVVLFFVYKTYQVVYDALAEVNGTAPATFGVEPIMFGLLYMGFDMLFIAMKNVFVKIVRDAEKKVSKK